MNPVTIPNRGQFVWLNDSRSVNTYSQLYCCIVSSDWVTMSRVRPPFSIMLHT